MCGRFRLDADADQIALEFGVEPPAVFEPRHNIAPSQPVLIVRDREGGDGRETTHVAWGLIPHWTRDPSIGSRMINARSETASEKPSFRAAMRYRRCLIPATGFYEWQRLGSRKQPHHIGLAGGGLFALAGLWETWQSPEGSETDSCAILTTEPNDLLAKIHNRMPVILPRAAWPLWLDRTVQRADDVMHLLQTFPAEEMATHPVSAHVNSPRNDDPKCAEPAEVESGDLPGLF